MQERGNVLIPGVSRWAAGNLCRGTVVQFKWPPYYVADVLHGGITRKIDQAHERLVEQLIRDGWLPTGECGADWWNRLFRRQVR